ncbi:hypothetical protein QYM36_013711 [Artemia franciscana]|uniref:J domain-containing protein n=1 Tax=Artemia franciscana TaxID=6661 RepID=A0AA88KZ32_ARTSF|nr:hypothetical protein QYM36_013711 [Artemia franciscana]
MIFAFYRTQQFDHEYANFDPYNIFGLDIGASNAEIKTAYKTKALVYHPDKETGDEILFMNLAKAYKALTDATSKRNWEQYGDPDGSSAISFGICLPSWIVKKRRLNARFTSLRLNYYVCFTFYRMKLVESID